LTTVHTNPIVRGDKVWLRPFERDDVEPSLRIVNDRDIADLVGFPFPIGKGASEKWYEEEVLKLHGERAFFFVICELGSAELIGQCGFHELQRGMRADVGIFLAPEYVGRGYGTDAMNGLIDFGFGELGLERIGLHVSPGNDRAIRSYEKSGFQHEGRLRSFRRRRGKVVDDIVMSIVRADWEALDRKRSWDYPAVTPKRKPARKKTATAARGRARA
jgi:RimJ/RimL family protein N-acetyltransferase